MRKLLLLLVFLIGINIVAAQDWVYGIKNAQVNTDISSEAVISPISSDYSLKEVSVNLSFFPKDGFNQKVTKINIEPEPKKTDDSLEFNWESPIGRISFRVDADVELYNKQAEVRNKLKFPIEDLPKELEIYTKPSETIDSDDEDIIDLASELAEGEDDLYVVLFKLADWTKSNIKYDLSTLTAEASQKASWVLKNRDGVCDEMTSLFIAMCRALGIPAKFVSGAAYTNLQDDFGSHGWAEAYMPGYGWVPFDVTYGEFGFVNLLHVKMQEAVDSGESSTSYRWLGRNVNLETKKLDVKTTLIKKETGAEAPVSLSINPIRRDAGFGSYNLVEVTAENLKGYYIATEIYLVKPREIEIIGEERQQVLLKPNQKKDVYWIIKVDSSLDNRYLYNFPLTAYSLRNASAQSSFSSKRDSPLFSLNEVQDILKRKREEDIKTYSKDVKINCSADKGEFYEYEEALVNCSIRNTGNVLIEKLNVCIDDECRKINLGISQTKILDFTIKHKERRGEILVIAENEQVSKAEYIKVRALDTPKIEITELNYPENAEFNDEFEISFNLGKASDSNPKDVSVIFEQNRPEREWEIEEMYGNSKFVIKLQAKKFLEERSNFTILVNYKDKHGGEYKTEKSFYINLVNLTASQKSMVLLNRSVSYIENMSIERFINILVVITITFILILWIVFRKGKNE